MDCDVIDSGRLPPADVMAKDADLLQQLDPNGLPILHLYEWEGDSLTYGYFTKPEDYLHVPELTACGIRMARRPTGGGIIFHLADLAFSVLIPVNHPGFSLNTLENYAYINRIVSRAIDKLTGNRVYPLLQEGCGGDCSNFCMSQPTQYDLIVNGRKVGGAAQRKTKRGYLHQGSISLTLPPQDVLRGVLKDEGVLEQMEKNSYPLLGDLGVEGLDEGRRLVRTAIQEAFERKGTSGTSGI